MSRPASVTMDLDELAAARDRELIDLARRGDPDALEAIARRELPRVQRLLIRLLGPRSDHEDLVQIVFLELCRALPGFRGESKLSTFIGGITIRVARRAMRPTAWGRRRTELPEDVESSAAGPEALVSAAQELARVQRALEKIAPKKRVAFLLWAVEGMTVEEIAEATGAGVAATRSRIYYAQKELRAKAERDPALKELLGRSNVGAE
ncbi:MAG: sigma-70 family RNA polymerase sigma factor [Deltaproteobacteria bacterium]|nr:sigma-70 family RNA polymerase sigma factor [Deltaproteobacteria bacterium]